MRQPLYIRAAAAISPQQSFEGEFLNPALSVKDGKLFVKEVDCTPYISPVAIRRMSKLLKLSIATGLRALKDAGLQTPDAIITGTGRGSMSDTGRFLKDIIEFQEGTLNPTSFIQSTYNAPNGWLAMQSKCRGYNQTYVNRGASLEMALLDAQMLFAEGEATNALVGSYDELTDEYYFVKSKIGYWKQGPPDSLQLLREAPMPGTIAGEGTAFFVLSKEAEHATCAIQGLKIFRNPDAEKAFNTIDAVLEENGMKLTDVDAIFFGVNGDSEDQPMYDTLLTKFAEATTIAGFKHLCGEYDTATGFALWLIKHSVENDSVPALCVLRQGEERPLKNVLLVNHYRRTNGTVMLLQKVS